ncbi:hypothetical protein PSPO01_02698 [Paraphaeosphaeria sporulosa]
MHPNGAKTADPRAPSAALARDTASAQSRPGQWEGSGRSVVAVFSGKREGAGPCTPRCWVVARPPHSKAVLRSQFLTQHTSAHTNRRPQLSPSRASSRSIYFVVAVISFPRIPVLIHHRLQSTANYPAFSNTSVSTSACFLLVSRNLATPPCGVVRTRRSTRAQRRDAPWSPCTAATVCVCHGTCSALTSPTCNLCRRPPFCSLHRTPRPQLNPQLL